MGMIEIRQFSEGQGFDHLWQHLWWPKTSSQHVWSHSWRDQHGPSGLSLERGAREGNLGLVG
jgi:hypothetical protein